MEFAAGGEDDLALSPGLGMDDERHSPGPNAPDHGVQSAVVVAVPVGHHYCPQIREPNLEHVHVVDRGLATEARIVDERGPVAVPLDGQQQREAMLGNQLLSLTLPHVVCHLWALRYLA